MKNLWMFTKTNTSNFVKLSRTNIFNKIVASIILMFSVALVKAATITSTASGGTWSTTSTWVGGIVPTTTDTAIITSGATVTLTASRTVINVTINSGGILNIGSVNALTVTGNFLNNGTFSGTTGRLLLTGLTGNFTNSGTFTMGTGRIYFYGNVISAGTHTLAGTDIRLYGNATQTISGFTSSGLVSMRKTGGIATLVGNLSCSGLTINGSGGTLNLGVGLTHTTSNRVTLSNGTLNGGSSILNVNVVSTSAWNGTGSVFVAGTSTVKFSAAGNQTLSNTSATTFNNLTLSNSGIKSITTSRCIVNGITTIEGTATVSQTPTYGAASTLFYNTATSRTVGAEWVTPFVGSGGVVIGNTGVMTLNAAKVFNTSIPLTINSGASLTTGNFQLTFGGNFNNSGTFTAGSAPIVITGTMAVQSIAPFTTTGLISMTKTSGVATFLGNVSSGGYTINGSGGTLNLGANFTHTSTGNITLTTGTLSANTSTLNVNAISATAWNGTGTVFSAGTSTVNFGAAGNQTLTASATTFNRLIFSNSGIKTLTTANCIANTNVSIEGTATVSATPTYGASATLQYNTSTSRVAGPEWITPFVATGGVIIANTGTITMNAAKVFNASIPLTINSGAALATGSFQINFGGNFINNGGTFTAGSSPIIIDNTMASQSIASITTTGLISMTKTSGTATLIGNLNGSGLTINGTGGTLNLGAALTHSFSGNFTRTAGTLNGGSSILKFAGTLSGAGGVFTANLGTIDYSGAAQSIVVLPYYNLTLSGSGTKTFTGTTTISNTISITSGVVANLLAGLTHTSSGLNLGGANQVIGSWGGTGSGASNINTTYFTATTGKINNNCSVATITFQPIAPSATCAGSGSQTISVTASGTGLSYLWRKGGVSLVNGLVVSGQGTNMLTLTAPIVADAGSYDVIVNGTCPESLTSNSVTVIVNATPGITAQPSATTVCQNTASSFVVVTSAVSPTYQWQYSSNPVTTWTNTNGLTGVSGNTSSTLSWVATPLIYNNFNFRCLVTSTNGCVSNTTPALLLINPTPTVGSISSNQALCSGSFPNDITLSSASGTIQWQRADNASFTINLSAIGTNSTTLSSAQIGALTTTTYFRALVSSGLCTTAVSATTIATIVTTTWTSAGGGSWTNGIPTDTKAAIVAYNYVSNGDLTACTLTVTNGAVVEISSGDNVELNGALTVSSGSFILNSNSNLIQNTDVANTGNIIVRRDTAALMRQDYILWSSPVVGQQLQAFTPETLATRFYTYNPSSNIYAVVSSPSTTNFATGKGYLIRVPNNHPAIPSIWNGAFTGTPNNGPVSLAVTNATYNAIGNPYPSTIDADAFIADNNIAEALYFWRKTNNNATSSYATYTTAGGVSNSAGDPLLLTPNGIIEVGQGFIAKSTSTSFDFTNSMRVSDNSDLFLRSFQDKDRIWLNLTSTAGFFGQMLLAYMPNATIGIDDAIDGRYFNDCQTALTSLIDNEEFSIQGRGNFEASDIVSLGFKSQVADTFTIAINAVEGLFGLDFQNIYLKDKLTNTLTDLKMTPYTFASEAGVFNDRFEVVYQNLLAVHTTELNSNQVVVYKQNHTFIIDSGNVTMKNINVFDIRGRLLLAQDAVNAKHTSIPMDGTNQVLLIQIITSDGSKITKKVLN